jgi:hypothetical protein
LLCLKLILNIATVLLVDANPRIMPSVEMIG